LAYIKLIRPQIAAAAEQLGDLRDLFFGENDQRQKRQLFIGLALALGVLNSGMSIYNTHEITKLHSELSGIKEDVVHGFKHVYHVLQEEDHAVFQITQNVNALKEVCRDTLDQVGNNVNEIIDLQNIISIGAMVNNVNAEIGSWGRALEFLTHGKLHPALVNKSALKKGFQSAQEQARKFGLKTLHQEFSSIYRSPISYIATKNEEIVVIIHIPLVEREPLELFEYLPTPVKVGNLFLTIEGQYTILATDLQGQNGVEMSATDLLRCQSEDVHYGKLFVCPNANLLHNNIRRSCLGAIFFGHQEEVLKKCLHFPYLREQQAEFVKQVSETTITLFTEENLTIRQTCFKTTKVLQNITGLTTITVPRGCKLTTEEHTFISPIIIDETTDFVKNVMKIPTAKLFNNTSQEKIEAQLKKLDSIKTPDRVHLEKLKRWIDEEETKISNQYIGYASSMAAFFGCITMMILFTVLYCRYRKNHTKKTKKSTVYLAKQEDDDEGGFKPK